MSPLIRSQRHCPLGELDPNPSIAEMDESHSERHRTSRHISTQAASIANRASLRSSSPLGAQDRPFRPFQRQDDQENQPDYGTESSSRLQHKDAVIRPNTGILDRPPPQPLQPAHVVPRQVESLPGSLHTPPSTHALIATRPAPATEQPSIEHLSLTQTALSLPLPVPQHLGSDSAQQAATLPTQALQPGKRSFLVSKHEKC